VLPEAVPVALPDLPPRRAITTVEQFKAIADPTRSRILSIIQFQPATAKQIAERLHITHGAAGHHLHVLETAGLVQIVAKRLVRGIVAKYYARTARIFSYEVSREITGGISPSVEIVTHAADELAETSAEEDGEDRVECTGFPHARLAPERARSYQERFDALLEEFLNEPPDPQGVMYGCLVALFRSPTYMQSEGSETSSSGPSREAGGPGEAEGPGQHVSPAHKDELPADRSRADVPPREGAEGEEA
jgi:DNA-binding transcriptional ArsR family regulator